MSTRERLEARAARRRKWAASRAEKAEALEKVNRRFRDCHAFMTQPGHIPERERMFRRTEKAAEHQSMARRHEDKADALEAQLAHSIFHDDEDACERLREKIEGLEQEREEHKALNAAWRKAGKPAPEDTEGWQKVAETLGCSMTDLEKPRVDMARFPSHYNQPYPSYALRNLGGRISKARQRLAEVETQQARHDQADDEGGVLVERCGEFATVTFAEKPPKATRDQLKAAGFQWARGSWVGEADRLPATVTATPDR